MKMKFLFLGAVSLAAVVSASADSIPVNITVSGGADVVAAPKSDLGDFGDGTVLSWMTTDIANYNALNTTTLSAPTSVNDQTGLSDGTGGNSITLDVTGLTYLFFHWGGQHGGWAQLFYVGGDTGDITFDNSAIGTGTGPSVGALSFYSTYNPSIPPPPTTSVPDGGSTMMMFGMALSGLGLVVRRLKQ